MPRTKQATDYRALTAELDDLIGRLEAGELEIDDAVQAYERSLAIIGQLEVRLQKAENKVSQLRAAHDGKAAE